MQRNAVPESSQRIAHELARAEVTYAAVSTRFLDDEARTQFARTIEEIEKTTAIEVVVAVRRRSAGYLHANVIVGGIVAVLGLAAMLFAQTPFSHLAILVDPVIVGLAAGTAVHWLPGVKRVLTPRKLRRRAVLAAARATFVERGVHNTLGRSGLLLYISWLEQHAMVIVDSGLAIPADALARWETELSASMRHGGAAVAKRFGELVREVAAASPRRADDLNELPDAIDSDLRSKS